MATALLAGQLQNDFIHPEGGWASADHRHILEHINKLVHATGFAMKVLIESHIPENSLCLARNHPGKKPWDLADIPNPKDPGHLYTIPLLPDCGKPGSWGAEPIDGVKRTDFDIVLEKFKHPEHITISDFSDIHGNLHADMHEDAMTHDLEKELKQRSIKNVVLVGAHGEFCVKYTAVDLLRLGHKVIVVEDAVAFADHSEKLREETWKELKSQGVQVVSIDDPVLSSLLTK